MGPVLVVHSSTKVRGVLHKNLSGNLEGPLQFSPTVAAARCIFAQDKPSLIVMWLGEESLSWAQEIYQRHRVPLVFCFDTSAKKWHAKARELGAQFLVELPEDSLAGWSKSIGRLQRVVEHALEESHETQKLHLRQTRVQPAAPIDLAMSKAPSRVTSHIELVTPKDVERARRKRTTLVHSVSEDDLAEVKLGRFEILLVSLADKHIPSFCSEFLARVPASFPCILLVPETGGDAFSVFQNYVETAARGEVLVAKEQLELRPGRVVIANPEGKLRLASDRKYLKIIGQGLVPSMEKQWGRLVHASLEEVGRRTSVLAVGMQNKDKVALSEELNEADGLMLAICDEGKSQEAGSPEESKAIREAVEQLCEGFGVEPIKLKKRKKRRNMRNSRIPPVEVKP